MNLNNQRQVIRLSEKDGKKFLALSNAPIVAREKGFLCMALNSITHS